MKNFKSTLATATRTFTDKVGDYNVSGNYAYNGDGAIVMCNIDAFQEIKTADPGISAPKNCGSLYPLTNPRSYQIPDDSDPVKVIPILKATYEKIVAEVMAETAK